MQSSSTSIAPWHTCYHYYYPVPPNRLFSHHHLHFHLPTKVSLTSYFHSKNHRSGLTLSAAAHSCSKEHEKKHTTNNNNHYPDTNPYPGQENRELFRDFRSSIENPEPQFEDNSSNMRWADLKAALGQRINLEGIACSVGIFSKDKQLVIPHVSVPDIRFIDWAHLKNRGFQGVVFDKDNTITVPYSLDLWPPLQSSLEHCKSLFGDNIAIFSNSAGLFEYDPDGKKAAAVEDAIGIKVIRHKVKKPGGTAEEIEKHFGCESSKLIMVGDRPFTDIVYGNRNGFFTILTEALSLAEEPLIVRQVRMFEVALVKRWSGKGLLPVSQKLIMSGPVKCVKDIPL
ncbi:hypothetical protein ABFS82_13G043100 [Erythranthe guttata]|uniref:Phosphatidylglycerophosphatase n=2 Tax=Erythranthe guttata TaxID=4155 RepID=A0A022QNR7_ERYGU|nr:PREDICTED: uncharacterized protein LOC105966707 [Erythranthe guttata]EYU29576.1 hypothetical protein MIMGU_mgv1a009489mg [Erythranthe guttata]|eukprot:XP_012846744.1 PREDICTED: uncharacterized protein LOC105966707 [Erythranthe guttata]